VVCTFHLWWGELGKTIEGISGSGLGKPQRGFKMAATTTNHLLVIEVRSVG